MCRGDFSRKVTFEPSVKRYLRFMVPAVCTGTRGERGDGQGLGLAALQGSWGREL